MSKEDTDSNVKNLGNFLSSQNRQEIFNLNVTKQINHKLENFSALPYVLQTDGYKTYLMNLKTHLHPLSSSSKIYIPVNEFPNINFIGLILGNNGDNLRSIEQVTRSRIYIKGIYKDSTDEPVHCHVTAENQSSIKDATSCICKIIEDAIFTSSEVEETDWEKFYTYWYFYNKILN